jgi:arylsulfatase A-like enzyme
MDIHRRRLLPAVAGAVLLAGCGPSIGPEEALRPPNVLLVVLDTVRADALSCYGNPRPTTPNLDRLASEGTRFENAYATCFWTLPSHASLLTGLYPSEAGATSETNQLPQRLTTLAEHLSNAGYRTSAIVRNAWLSQERGFAQGFESFIEDWRDDTSHEAQEEEGAVELATAWMGERVDNGEPFFLFVNLNIAHLPYTPPNSDRARFASRPWSGERVERLMAIQGGWGHLAGRQSLGADDFRLLRDLYEAEVSIADRHVGRMLGWLEDRGQIDRTLVIVVSDHGENLGDHGRIDHVYSLYDTTVRVPLIVRHPARAQAGSVRSELVSLIDVAPTILEAAGLSDPGLGLPGLALDSSELSGRSIVFAENGRPINGIRLLEKWFPEFDASSIDHSMRMIRSGPFKLIWTADVSAELFDIESDPRELEDLSPTRPELGNRLLADLRSWSRGIEPRAVPRAFESTDRESLEKLRRLGYVE